MPGGAVDGGETLTSAAVRETLEEAGLHVELKGILAIEYNPCGKLAMHSDANDYLVRLRVVFYAEPTEASLHCYPKSCPDFESAGAAWCSLEQMTTIKLRGSEPLQWVHQHALPHILSFTLSHTLSPTLSLIHPPSHSYTHSQARYLSSPGGTIYPMSLLRERIG